MNRYLFMDQEAKNRQYLLDFLDLLPRNGRIDHVYPKGHHGRCNDKIMEIGQNLMNRYLFMDQEAKNRQYLLDFLDLLPEMVVSTMCTQRVTMVDLTTEMIKMGQNLMNRYLFMDQEAKNRQYLLDFLDLLPRNGRIDHVYPKGHHGRCNDKIMEIGQNLMNRYLFMDQEAKNRQYLLDFLDLLPEMVVSTMCTQRVTMVDLTTKMINMGQNLMNRYLFMDQEAKNRQYLLDFLDLLPEMVVSTMCAQRVTMVDLATK